MPLGLAIDDSALEALCQEYRVKSLELFGSRARGQARPDSDVDLLVTYEDGYTPGLEFIALADALEALFGCRVDLMTRQALESHRNDFFRKEALASVEPMYAR